MSSSVFAIIVAATSVLSQPAPTAPSASRPSPWRISVMDNGTLDEKHPTPEAQARMIGELGLDGYNLNKLDGVTETLAALDREGLKLFTLYAQAHLDESKPKYDPRLPGLIRTLKGRPTMIWLTIQSDALKPSMPEGDARAVEIVRELGALAAASNVRIALYPHFGFWMERVEDAVRIAARVNRPNVGVTFNLCHWLRADRPETLDSRLRAARPYLFSVTINGADADSKDWDRLIQPLGQGSYDVGILLRKLEAMGYDGAISLQCFAVKGDKYENLRRSMVAWRKLNMSLRGSRSAATRAERG